MKNTSMTAEEIIKSANAKMKAKKEAEKAKAKANAKATVKGLIPIEMEKTSKGKKVAEKVSEKATEKVSKKKIVEAKEEVAKIRLERRIKNTYAAAGITYSITKKDKTSAVVEFKRGKEKFILNMKNSGEFRKFDDVESFKVGGKLYQGTDKEGDAAWNSWFSKVHMKERERIFLEAFKPKEFKELLAKEAEQEALRVERSTPKKVVVTKK